MYVKGDFPTWNYNDVAGREKQDVMHSYSKQLQFNCANGQVNVFIG